MRHNVDTKRKLGRNHGHRKAMMRNLAISLIEHGRIETTITRAKVLKMFIEPLITLGKKADQPARRLAFSRLANKDATHKLFEELAPKFKERNGGYTRVIRSGIRVGDAVQKAFIEFVDK